MFDCVIENDLLQEAICKIRRGHAARLTGVWGSSSALIAAGVGRVTKNPVLFVTPHLDDADATADDIELFIGDAGEVVHQFPAWEAQLADDHINEEVTGERLRLLNLLTSENASDEKVKYIVAPIMALLQPVPTPQALAEGKLILNRGEQVEIETLLEWLTDARYEHVDQVDQQGEFAHRGGIVDVFQPGSQAAVRIEFFGDQIESIREFDLDTQRSTDELEACDFTALTVGRSMGEKDNPESGTTHLLDYLPPETIVCMVDPHELREMGEHLYDRIRDDLVDESSPVSLRKVDEIFDAVGCFARVEMFMFSPKRDAESVRVGIRSLERLSVNTAEALGELEELSDVADVHIYCENQAEETRFREMLAKSHEALGEKMQLHRGHLTAGFYWPGAKLVVVGHSEIYQRYAKIRRIRRVRAGRPIQSMLDLVDGDYVVHVGHGIAKFDGLRRMDRDDVSEEYLKLKFADSAVLNVPVSQINLVQKYIGSKGQRPRLSKLGGGHWARAKEKVTAAVKDLAADMLHTQAVRRESPGISYPTGTELQRQFADEFLYTETEDQLSAIGQIDNDMVQTQPMDRLICGDVGYGKTEIAMRAAIKTVEAGRQVGVLVPTTVLADQHHRTFCERFADFPVTIEVLSRFRTPKQQREIIKRLALGQVDILIGTHRLLSKDVIFPDIGLVVIDEEQRFGVKHKEHLKSIRATLDVLTLTATPIPRTLHMALLGLRDISALETPPLDRRSIHTEVVPVDDELIRAAITRELNREGQVFFVHNRVSDIDSVARHVQSLVGDARIAVGHGQMPERSLEKVMMSFTRGEIDVLICTTIIESGLDIPTANTMIIHEADRFGLAEMHQLRGRVGRYKHKAYCYLLLPDRRTVSPVAAKRLKAIEDFSDLGAGFQIAMRDLEIRGAGNILGSQQSGHIAVVGYELYCQLLEQAVAQHRGDPIPVAPDAHIEIGIDAYIPKSYIPSERQRMEVYRRILNCHAIKEIDLLSADIADAYGRISAKVELLLEIARLRVLAAKAGIDSIVLMAPDVVFRVKDPKKLFHAFEGAAGSLRTPDSSSVYWRPPGAFLENPTLLNVLLRRLSRI